jgi:hypothetical protein
MSAVAISRRMSNNPAAGGGDSTMITVTPAGRDGPQNET